MSTMKIETLTSKTDNKNWHLLVAYGVLNNELIFEILVTGIKSCEVRKWIKALTLDEATDRTRAGKIYTIELKDIGNCRNTLSTVQNGKKKSDKKRKITKSIKNIKPGKHLSYSEWSISKIIFWTSKQPFTIYFLLTTCNVCSMAIPEIFVQTQVSDYWQLIHWLTQNEWNKILVHLSLVLFWFCELSVMYFYSWTFLPYYAMSC